MDWSKEYEIQFEYQPLAIFDPWVTRRLAQNIKWTERFRLIIDQARFEGHRIDHVLVNTEGEQKLLCEPSFVAAQLSAQPSKGDLHLGHYMGVDIFHAPGQSEMIVFVIETKKGFYTVTGTSIEPWEPPGPVFIMEIKP